jgi:hypothetical protein
MGERPGRLIRMSRERRSAILEAVGRPHPDGPPSAYQPRCKSRPNTQFVSDRNRESLPRTIPGLAFLRSLRESSLVLA